jgi:LacI family transcriptional regulator
MEISINPNNYFCPNATCGNHGKRGQGNIVLHNTYGKNRRRLLKCTSCNSRFSERQSSVFFGLHTKETKIREVILYLIEGMSFREVADASDLDKDTVQRIWKRFVRNCEDSMESLLKEFNVRLEDIIMLLYRRIPKRVK